MTDFDGWGIDLSDDARARNWDAQMHHTPKNTTPAKKKYKKPEGDIQAKCVEFMEMLGFVVLRTNAGVWRTAEGNYIHGIQEGGADLHCNAWGAFLAVETKAPKKGLRPKQREYRDKVEARGGTYIAPHSVEELRAELCAAYGPQRVGQWETEGRARVDGKKARVVALKRKMGQIK